MMSQAKPITWYPPLPEDRRKLQEISDAEGKLPETRVMTMAVRAFARLYEENWVKAMEYARPERPKLR
jgi:hypothetical protein